MKALKVLAHPLIIFVLCFPLMQAANYVPQMIAFGTFCSWALYFLLGANPKSGLFGAICFIIGEICGIFIILQLAWTPFLGSFSLTIAVAVWAGLMVLLAERVPAIGAVPAYFIGAGLYFAAFFGGNNGMAWIKNPLPSSDFVTPLIYLAGSMIFGFFMGWCTIQLYNWWGGVSKKSEAPAVAKAR